jgi:putative ABC transport system ATP-binding protein
VKTLLSVRDVTKIYGKGPISVTALDCVSLEVLSGEVVLILGPSGSGKTTLLSIMGCMLRPTHGDVLASGCNVNTLSDGELARLRREQIGFVFQSFNLLPFLTVRQNVEVALNLNGTRRRQARERASELLHSVQLDHRLDFWPRDLSGGEKQRVSIARALANDPKVLLADEPTGSLDSQTGRTVVDLLAGLAREKGSGVVIVTHDNRIVDVADRVLHLVDGALARHAGA